WHTSVQIAYSSKNTKTSVIGILIAAPLVVVGRAAVDLCTEVHHHAHHRHHSGFRSSGISLLAAICLGSLRTSFLRWSERRACGLSHAYHSGSGRSERSALEW